MLNEFKRCPFCNESVSADASKCRYCYEWISQKPSNFKEETKLNNKISYSKKQVIVLAIFALVFTSSIFVFGAKAFRAIVSQPEVAACSFDDIKTADGYIFRLMDDPDKKISDNYVIRDKETCKYYIKLGNDSKFEVTPEFQGLLFGAMENTSQEAPNSIMLSSEEQKKIHLSLDVVNEDKSIQERLIEFVDSMKPQTVLTLQVYGGNSENVLSQHKLSINYTSPELNMYKKTFERQREVVIYIKDSLMTQEKIDLNVVNSNDIEFIRREVETFYETFKGDSNYNQSKFLFPYLEYLANDYEDDVEYRILTDGSFERVDSRYYNFNETHFNYHSRKIIERLKIIEDARKQQEVSDDPVEIPNVLPPFYTYFDTKLKEKVNTFKYVCFDLVQSEKDRSSDWLNERNRLYNNLTCK
ncbi:zinc ribbon domain-containing protein [Patescibacteria group bacterium]|nr:zinc ribbon domain-containing protein [Patescibacteria group bacterium]